MISTDVRPFVTVVVTVGGKYATDAFLGRALASLVQQDYPHDRFEVVVVDDGTGCRTLVDALAARHHDSGVRIRYEGYTPARGVGYASQHGLMHASGELFVRVDADDTVMPYFLESLVNSLLATRRDHPDWCVAYSYGILELVDDSSGARELLALNADTVRDHGAGVLFVAEIVRQVGGYNPGLRNAEDHDLFLRLRQAGFQGFGVSRVLYEYHRHGDNTTADLGARARAVAALYV